MPGRPKSGRPGVRWSSLMAPGAAGPTVAAGLGSALAMGLPLLGLVAAGHPKAAVYAAFGAFTGLYGHGKPYRLRARTLAVVAVMFLAAVALGSTCALLVSGWWWVGAVAVVAAAAKWGCDRAGVGAPGAWMFLFAFAAPTQLPTTGADVGTRALLAAGGAAVAWCVAMAPGLRDPRGPERRATATALCTTADVIALGAAATTRQWHQAHAAINRAAAWVGSAPPVAARRLQGLLHWAEGELTDAVLAPAHPAAEPTVAALRREAVALRPPTRRALVAPQGARPIGRPVRRREAESPAGPTPDVLALRRRSARHAAVLRLLTAGRVLLGAGVAGLGALALHLGHPYWAPISAAAVLQSTHVRMTWHRSVHRGLGTAAGLLLGALLLLAHPPLLAVAGLVVLMQLGIEVFNGRSYGIGVMFLTPLTLLLSELLRPSPTYALLTDRLTGVLLGIVVGLGAALLVAHPRAAVTLRDALERCRVAMEQPGSGRDGWGLAATEELRDALVELRTADHTARGEAWPAGIPHEAVAEVEGRAYRVLASHRQALRDGEPVGR